MKKVAIYAIDLIFCILYSSIGMCLFLLYGFMGPESDFVTKNDFFRDVVLSIIIISHIIIGFGMNIHFRKLSKKNHKVKIDFWLFIINFVIIVFPYIALIPEVLL